jgi:hypothetical protein
MKQEIKIKASELAKALEFVNIGVDKDGANVDSKLLHYEVRTSGQKSYFILTTRRRFVPRATRAIIIDGAPDVFTGLVEYERLYNVARNIDKLEVTLKDSGNGNIYLENYPFSKYELPYDLAKDDLENIGTIDFEKLNAMLAHSRIFASTDRNNVSANAVSLVYDTNSQLLRAMVFNSRVLSVFKIQTTGLSDFQVSLSSSVLHGLAGDSNQPVTLFHSPDNSKFGILQSNGRVTFSTIPEAGNFIATLETAQKEPRPYNFTVNTGQLANAMKRLAGFTSDDILAKVGDGSLQFFLSLTEGKSVDAIPCRHTGIFQMELKPDIVLNVLRILHKNTEDVTFNLHEDSRDLMVSAVSNRMNWKYGLRGSLARCWTCA